jgi:hypothetical protein
MLHQSMVDLYPSENLNAGNLLSVQHFVYKLLFHVHLPRFGDILIWINRSKSSQFFIFSIQIHIWIGSVHHGSIRKVPWRTINNFRIRVITKLPNSEQSYKGKVNEFAWNFTKGKPMNLPGLTPDTVDIIFDTYKPIYVAT